MSDFQHKCYSKAVKVSRPKTREEWVAYRSFMRHAREVEEIGMKILENGLFDGKPVYHHGDKIWG